MSLCLSEVIAALERGEEVECADKGCITWENVTWGFLEGLGFSYAKEMQFRIKPAPPEPMEIWVNFYLDEPYVYKTKKHAKKHAKDHAKIKTALEFTRVAVHFREVVGEA